MSQNSEPSADKPRFYVGIGASAGGLEALKAFFNAIPPNLEAAFIVIQHLSPDFTSVMDELLAKVTNMPIHYIKSDLVLEANTIYLNTPRTQVSLKGDRFVVTEKVPDKKPDMPIDFFFRSLGEEKGKKAIAVVLSGTGSDGSRGIASVKDTNGLIIVQDPTDAKFNGMPNSSIDTGLPDVVLPVVEMGEKLTHFMDHPSIHSEKHGLKQSGDQNEEALNDIFDLLKAHRDIDFAQYKPTTIARRIERRMGINQFHSVTEYYRFLLTSAEELEILGKDLLIGVTSFFRDKEAFDVLRSEVLPEIIKATAQNETVRVWVAGCSKGDEAYSIAIAIDQVMKTLNLQRNVKVFATDVDPHAIAEAGVGSYSLSIADELDPEILAEYFELEGDHYLVRPTIRRMIIFAVHNLLKDPPFSNLHLASCRNVLIYFKQSVQRRVLAGLQFSLMYNGFLLLGSSESLAEAQKCYRVIDERNRIFKKIENLKMPLPAIARENSDSQRVNSPRAPSVSVLLKAHRGQDRDVSYRAVIDALFRRYIPPTIVVDQHLNVVHIYGDVSPYTRSPTAGQFSTNIGYILVESLHSVVTTAIHGALDRRTTLCYENVIASKEEQKFAMNLQVTYVKTEFAEDAYVLVTFDRREPFDNQFIEVVPFDQNHQHQERIKDLERQLKHKQEHLQVTIEELETTNEELQASNEELMASNEELQSTNEELQSVNEELYTVNNEFQEKINEITRVNLDLDNLIKSSQIGIIFLDESMMIRHYTPAAATYIHLLPSDIGRPFHHISHKLRYPNLLQDISDTVKDGKMRARETISKDEVDILVRINPYFAEDQAVKGCVISLTNISEITTLKANLSRTQATLRSLLQARVYAPGEPVNVLVLDDNSDDIELISDQLEEIKSVVYKVFSTTRTEQAHAILAREDIKICLIDYRLAGMTAMDFIKACDPKIHRECAFIIITAAVTDTISLEAQQEGVFDSIAKSDLSPSLLAHVFSSTIKAQSAVKMLQ